MSVERVLSDIECFTAPTIGDPTEWMKETLRKLGYVPVGSPEQQALIIASETLTTPHPVSLDDEDAIRYWKAVAIAANYQ